MGYMYPMEISMGYRDLMEIYMGYMYPREVSMGYMCLLEISMVSCIPWRSPWDTCLPMDFHVI